MKYPLRWYHTFARQVVCKLAGHDWKFCARPKVRDDYPSWWTRGRLGNPFFEPVASWCCKCRRCGRKGHEATHPWYKWYWWAAKDFFSCWWIYATNGAPWTKGKEGYGFSRASWPVYLVGLFIGGPLFGFEQAWLGYFHFQREWPSLPGEIVSAIHLRLGEWMEQRTTHFRWLPPDSGHPNEMGFWINAAYHDPSAPRPRIYADGGVNILRNGVA